MPVHIIVCIKSVVKAATRGVAKRVPENSELNPFDRPAIEAALEIGAHQGGTVTVLSMGPAVSREALSEALAMGADRAVLVSDPTLAESDTLVTAKVLAAAIQKLGAFDMLLFGTRTSDSDTGQVGPQVAALLGIGFVSRVQSIAVIDQGWEIERTMDAWQERWQVTAPAAATIDARAFAPRPVGLVGISDVYDDTTIDQWALADLDLAADQVGLQGSPTRVAALKPLRRDRHCEMLDGEPLEQVNMLMSRLAHEGALGN